MVSDVNRPCAGCEITGKIRVSFRKFTPWGLVSVTLSENVQQMLYTVNGYHLQTLSVRQSDFNGALYFVTDL